MLHRIILGAGFLVVGAIFLFIGGRTYVEEETYQQRGVRAPAIVTGKALRLATSHSATSYEISYRVNAAEGTAFEQADSVDVHLWERVEQGSPLTVEYFAGAPESARVLAGDDADENNSAIAALAVGAVLVLLAPIGWFALRKRDRLKPVTDGDVPSPQEAAAPEVTFWPIARKSPGFWFGGIALLFGLPWLIVNGIVPLYDGWRFAEEGRSTQGMVLTKEIRRSGNTRSENLHYEVTYRFTVPGETIEGRDELSLADWERLVERESADVLYRAQEPSSNRLTGRRPWFLKTLFGLIGLVLTVLGSRLSFRAVRSAQLDWRLRRHGVSAQGTVTELKDRYLRINRVRQWRLHYEYVDFEGQRHLKTFDLPQDEAQGWKVGDVGVVLYDPARPAEAVWRGRGETQ